MTLAVIMNVVITKRSSLCLKACVLLMCLLSFMLEAAGKTYNTVVVDEVTSIYDADTFRVNINTWADIIGQGISIRVLGIDAPEIRGKCKAEKQAAQRARLFTVMALTNARRIELRNIKRGKYFRILADVWVDGKRLSLGLIKAGHARVYKGGKRLGWCG